MPELEDLLVDRAELDRALLFDALSPYIGIDGQRRELVPKGKWAGLNPNAKILVFLLGRKAMAAMPDVDLEVEGAAPKEIEEGAGVKGGTLRPKLGKMKSQGLLSQDTSGAYFVPTHAVLRVKEIISGGNGSDGN